MTRTAMGEPRRAGLTRRALVAGAAAGGLAAALPDATVTAATRGTDAARFDIAGARLRWGGLPVRLTGVAVGDPIYIRKGRPRSDYRVIAADWGANVVRISLHPGHWRQDRDQALEALGGDIAAARAAGLFVIVDWHVIGFPDAYMEPTDPAWGLPADAYDPDLALATSFWTEMARGFGRDPGILFELWNEPVVDPKLWVNTGQHWPRLKATWLTLIETVRRHSEAIVVVAGGRWAHDLVGVKRDPIADGRTAYAWHCYPKAARGDSGGWASSLDGLSAVRPVIVTEWGFCADCDAELRGTPEDFGLPFTRDVLDPLHLHSTAWCWSPGAAPAMLEPDWSTPNRYGRCVHDYLRTAG